MYIIMFVIVDIIMYIIMFIIMFIIMDIIMYIIMYIVTRIASYLLWNFLFLLNKLFYLSFHILDAINLIFDFYIELRLIYIYICNDK